MKDLLSIRHLYLALLFFVIGLPFLFFAEPNQIAAAKYLVDFPPIIYFAFFIVMPLIEEIAFRSWLVLNNKKWWIIGGSLFLFLLIPQLKLWQLIVVLLVLGALLLLFF
jgi:hypothetical protein